MLCVKGQGMLRRLSLSAMESQMREQREVGRCWEGDKKLTVAFILTCFDLEGLFNFLNSFLSSLDYIRGNKLH